MRTIDIRRAAAGGAAAVVLVATAFVVAPTVWSESQSPGSSTGSSSRSESSKSSQSASSGNRRVLMLDGRGSSIGVSIRDLDRDDAVKAEVEPASGVLIEDVDDDSPAAKAGLREGDVIVEFDGERVRSARHFARLVQETADGRTVKATLVRDGSRQTVDLTPERGGGRTADVFFPNLSRDIEREVERGLRALPRDFAFDFKWDGDFPGVNVWSGNSRMGAQLSPLTDQLAEYFGAKDGVLVSSVEPESLAAQAGLKAGDVITSVNGRSVETPQDVRQELRNRDDDRKEIEIGVLRDKKSLTLKAPMPERTRPATRRYVRPA